ncbi:MAG: hypothetical protein ACR2GH_11395 [Pseudonocardia sp.]
MAVTVDRAIDDLDAAMHRLRKSVRGIPFRAGGFRTTHRNLARDVAFLMVQLDSARGMLDGRNGKPR